MLRKSKEKYGIVGNVYEWLRDYLDERYQNVKVKGEKSGSRAVESGVPQGRKLGPLLIILYINDLPSVLRYCEIHMLADDMNILQR